MAPVLLCDLDGTLVDTVHDLSAALNSLLAESDLPALDEATVRTLVGWGAARLVTGGFAKAGHPLAKAEQDATVTRFIEIYDNDPARHSPPYPGVVATLTHLARRGWRLGVCTNKPQKPSDDILEALDLARFFEAVGGGDRFPTRKPDGAHLHATLELMGAHSGDAVIVGDSRADLFAARDADMPCVLVTYGYGQEDLAALKPDALIDRFDQLPDALARLGR